MLCANLPKCSYSKSSNKSTLSNITVFQIHLLFVADTQIPN